MSLSKSASKVSLLALSLFMLLPGCKTPEEYRKDADKSAYENINTANKALFNRDTDFTIESSEDQLRRRLFEAQGLQYSGKASLGVENLDKPEHWPEENYPAKPAELDDLDKYKEPLNLSLVDALQIAAGHNFDYQEQKEGVFSKALDLDNKEHYFDTFFSGDTKEQFDLGTSQDEDTVYGHTNTANIGASKTLKNGVAISASLGHNIIQMLSHGSSSTTGTKADASFTVPLLRGSGEHIVTERLTQAQRDLTYALYNFERYKKNFAVDVAKAYYNVLQTKNEIENAKANFESVQVSANRAIKMADAGRMTNTERDQAIQKVLNSKNTWLSAIEVYNGAIDSFKIKIGLPVDAKILLDNKELENVITYTENTLKIDVTPTRDKKIDPKDEPGPYELEPSIAIKNALTNRLDLKIQHGRVFDSQRSVIVLADQLRAELTIGGSASYGKFPQSNDGNNGNLVFNDAAYSTFLNIDLPFDREEERNQYREGLISLQQNVRNCQKSEDEIKLDILNDLGRLRDQRNTLQIQSESVRLAEDRVRSSNMFLEAGRVEMRDLLEAEEALLKAKNTITASVIAYRLAELQLQLDMGLLEVDENGLWHEFKPSDEDRAKSDSEQDKELAGHPTGQQNL